jgi:hypothetical protein
VHSDDDRATLRRLGQIKITNQGRAVVGAVLHRLPSLNDELLSNGFDWRRHETGDQHDSEDIPWSLVVEP